MKKETRGILLIALGSPFYGHLAANLAASIKFTCPDLKIKLMWSENALDQLTDQKRGLFDIIEEAPKEDFHRDGRKSYVKAKTRIFDYSPFDQTIFLDVDVIMLPKKTMNEAFDMLNKLKLDFTMENRSRLNLAENHADNAYLWAKVSDIKREYKATSGFLYGLHSEFIFFKKNKRISDFFDTVKEEFENPKCEVRVFDGDLPDEFGFAMAMIKHKIYPHECPFIPLYWYLTDNKLGTTLEFCSNNFFGYSVGGNQTPIVVRQRYDKLAKTYFQRMSLQHPFKIKQKRAVFASRAKM